MVIVKKSKDPHFRVPGIMSIYFLKCSWFSTILLEYLVDEKREDEDRWGERDIGWGRTRRIVVKSQGTKDTTLWGVLWFV